MSKHVKKVLFERLDKIYDSYTNYVNNPYAPETAHRLRVNTRKLRGLLHFLKPILGEEQYDAMNYPLRGLGKVYAPVRDLDVLIDICGDIAMEQPDLSAHYKNLFDYLYNERRKAMENTFLLKNKEQAEKTLSTIKVIINEVSITLADQKENNWDEFTRKRLKKMNQKMETSSDQMDWQIHNELHKTRIRAKKVRYASNGFGSLTNKNTKKLVKSAKKRQNDLGELTDLYVNADILFDYAQKVDDTDLQKLFSDMGEIQENKREQLLKKV